MSTTEKFELNERFKFRIWDKQNKRHIYNIERTYDSNNESGAWSFAEILEDDNFIVEQCTGLRDKNGKLIYEGGRCTSDSRRANMPDYSLSWGILRGVCQWVYFSVVGVVSA